MPVEYAMGYRKPPVSGRFQKGQSGNPAGRPRPRPTRRQRFAQMLEADLMEPVEKLATRPTRSTLAAWAKGMALDGVRGKAAIMRLAFSLWDELDVMEGNLEPKRRGRPVRLVEEVEAADAAAAGFDNEEEADVPVHPVSQGIIEEERLPMWGGYAGEAPGSESKAESLSAAPEEGASPLTEGKEQGAKTESERQFLAEAARNARQVPSEKELRRRETQAEAERLKRVYDSLPGKIRTFCDKYGYEYPGQAQGVTNPRPAEGPYTRALRERLLKLAAAERAEAERKAALAAKAVPLTPTLSPRSGGEGDVSPPPDIGVNDPEPLPDYAIWMRGQRAPP